LSSYNLKPSLSLEITKKLLDMPELGNECKDVFRKRISEAETRATQLVAQWTDYTVIEKTLEAPRIVRLELTSVSTSGDSGEPISCTLLKPPNALQHVYSIVTGTTSSFTLGIALDGRSRGSPLTYTTT
jgi:hypothetical protein